MNNTILIIPTKDIKGVDVLANINPMMTKSALERLTKSIKVNGQLEPITLFRGRIVDGRNRYEACKILGLETMKYVKLPHNISNKGKLMYISNKENRRHQTVTQLACTAVYTWRTSRPDITQAEFVKQENISQTNFTNANYIYNNNTSYFKILRDGGKLNIDRENPKKLTDSLRAIVNAMKLEVKRLKEVSDSQEEMNSKKQSIEDYEPITEENRNELPISFVLELIEKSKPKWCRTEEFIEELQKLSTKPEPTIDEIFEV